MKVQENEIKYIDAYYKFKKRTSVLTVLLLPQVYLFVGLIALVFAYNIFCAGCYCDGSVARSCTPSEEPFLFFIIFLWLAEIIVVAGSLFSAVRKMNKNKIIKEE